VKASAPITVALCRNPHKYINGTAVVDSLQQLLVQYVFSKLTQAVFLADDLAEIFIA
jgi:hypothetical protein